MKIPFKKLDPEAKAPTRSHADDAGLDLYAAEEYALSPGERQNIRTGIALAIPTGFVGLIWDKSGVASKTGMKTMGGVIDASYRGEIQVILANFSDLPYRIEKGAKIAQLLVQKIELPELEEAEILEATPRGEKGFGSSGTH